MNQEFDLKAYQGHWFEVARQNAPFEAFCASSTADYKYVKTGLLVTNHCLNKNGVEIQSISGKAVPIPGAPTGTFSLTFETGQKGIYNVIYTDYTNFSFVGNQVNKYLSILSRDKILTPGEVSLLKQLASLYGFNNLTFTN